MTDIPKMGKAVVVDVDGVQVELLRVPVRRYDWAHTEAHRVAGGHPREQALLEIRMDGKPVGLASRAHGWGAQSWAIDRLEPTDRRGVWLGEERLFGKGYVERNRQLFTPEAIAAKAVELRGKPGDRWGRNLMTVPELNALCAREAADKIRRDQEAEENSRRWAVEAAERKRRAIEHRDEVLAGLHDIEARSDLSNLERAAIVAAVARYSADKP